MRGVLSEALFYSVLASLAKLRQQVADASDENMRQSYEANIKQLEADAAAAEANPPALEPSSPLLDAADTAQFSYAMGLSWARQFPAKWPLAKEPLCEGFETALAGEPMPLGDEEYEAILFYIKNGIQFEKKLTQQQNIAKTFLEKNKLAENVKETESGLQYKLITTDVRHVVADKRKLTRSSFV